MDFSEVEHSKRNGIEHLGLGHSYPSLESQYFSHVKTHAIRVKMVLILSTADDFSL